MKRFLQRKGAALAALLLIAPTVSVSAAGANVSTRDLNEQSVLALAWVQTSAEYRALCYQAYNLAILRVDQAIAAHRPGGKPLAIVSDCDETLLNNSAFQAAFVGRNEAYGSANWIAWEQAAIATAMPGASEFLRCVAARGVTVFYVTNRDVPGKEGTIKNIGELGFPFADADHVLFKTTTSDKQPRFDAVAKDYEVILYLGDNEGDFPVGSHRTDRATRNELVDAHRGDFGAHFIVLPNPLYGGWEEALADNYFRLNPTEKDKARKDVLQRWELPAAAK